MRVVALLFALLVTISQAHASAIPVSLPSNLISTSAGIATNGAAGLAGGSAAVTLTTHSCCDAHGGECWPDWRCCHAC